MTPQTRALVLDNARIVDGTGSGPIETGRIVIEGDRIARIAPTAKMSPPAMPRRSALPAAR